MTGRILRGFDALLPPSVALATASVGATLSTFVLGSTLFSSGPVVPTWPVLALFGAVFPIHFRSVRLLLPDRDLKRRVLAAPRKLLVVAATAGVVAFPLVMDGVFAIGGQPERHHGRYFVDAHGDLRPVTRAQYRYTERLEQRIFAGGALLFYLLGVVINAGEVTLSASAGSRGRPSTWPGPASVR